MYEDSWLESRYEDRFELPTEKMLMDWAIHNDHADDADEYDEDDGYVGPCVLCQHEIYEGENYHQVDWDNGIARFMCEQCADAVVQGAPAVQEQYQYDSMPY